jgi:hypothetical protein
MQADAEGGSDESWPITADALEVDTFELSVYLVIVAQFRPFLESGTFRE